MSLLARRGQSEDAPSYNSNGKQGDPAALRVYLDSELLEADDFFIWKRPYLETLRDSDRFCSLGFYKYNQRPNEAVWHWLAASQSKLRRLVLNGAVISPKERLP